MVATVMRACFVNVFPPRSPHSYSIDLQKFDETKHYVAEVKRFNKKKKFMRSRRGVAPFAWHVLVHKRLLRWRIAGHREYELALVTPPQYMKTTSARALWKARDRGLYANITFQIEDIQAHTNINFVVFEVDSATSNKMYLAHA